MDLTTSAGCATVAAAAVAVAVENRGGKTTRASI